MKTFKLLFQLAIIWLPWAVRRPLLCAVLGFEIHPSAWIGKSLILPRRLFMAEGSRIGHGNFAHGLEEIRLERFSSIGRLNWISGFPLGGARYFKAFPDRSPRLHLEEHSRIVHRSMVDCTDTITIGRFTVLAGNRHQLMTHGIDLRTGNQSCAPLSIGAYCLVGTGCIFLKGTALPDYCALGAGSVVHKKNDRTHMLYSGTPAIAVRELDPDLAFFHRKIGASDSE